MEDKLEVRSIIKFLYLEGNTPQQIFQRLSMKHGDIICPSYETVKYWVRKFKHGHMSIVDEPREGRPVSAITDEKVKLVKALVLEDRRLTIRELEEQTGLSHGSVVSILHDYLNMTKVSARWIPRLLTPEMKAERKKCCKLLLDMHRQNDEFIDQIVTMDESWVYLYDPETKQQSMQWKNPSSPAPKKARVERSAVKVMLSVFWDTKGIIMTDYLPTGKSITGEYFSDLLLKLKDSLKSKRRGKLTKGVFLLQDNAPSHKSALAVGTAQSCGYEILPHPAYSPDLAPSDFFLFPQLKKQLKGKRFDSQNEVIRAVEDWFQEKSRVFYSQGLLKVIQRWEKCVLLSGDYVEK